MLPVIVLFGLVAIALSMSSDQGRGVDVNRRTQVTTAIPKTSASTDPAKRYTPAYWQPLVLSQAPFSRVPGVFAMNWLTHESGGKPCAFGTATALGPDGHPREQGLAQVYNPDDFKSLGIPSGSLRVYCQPGTQTCTRLLSADEELAQVNALFGLIRKCRAKADVAMSANGVRGWGERDYWRLVKLVHALPGLVKGLAYVTKSLGRPPLNWAEFKGNVLAGTKLDAGTERYREMFPRLFANAEKTAAGIPEGGFPQV